MEKVALNAVPNQIVNYFPSNLIALVLSIAIIFVSIKI